MISRVDEIKRLLPNADADGGYDGDALDDVGGGGDAVGLSLCIR